MKAIIMSVYHTERKGTYILSRGGLAATEVHSGNEQAATDKLTAFAHRKGFGIGVYFRVDLEETSALAEQIKTNDNGMVYAIPSKDAPIVYR